MLGFITNHLTNRIIGKILHITDRTFRLIIQDHKIDRILDKEVLDRIMSKIIGTFNKISNADLYLVVDTDVRDKSTGQGDTIKIVRIVKEI